MAEYLLSVHMVEGEDAYVTEEEMQEAFRDVEALNEEMRREEVWVFAGGLEPADIATVVRVQDGEVITTDGPFAETKEHIGGFWVLDVPDLDAALRWAEKATIACKGPVEVRPFQAE